MEMKTMVASLWQPTSVEGPAIVAEFGAFYTGRSRAFVVYRSGTIVFSDTESARPDDDYDATLLDAVNSAPDFNVREMEDGNFLVRFKGPVTGIVLGSFYEAHRESIRTGVDAGALLPGEEVRLGTEVQVPREHYYVGLYARSKLFVDAESREICERFEP
jgi:hypothetical protein